MAWKNRASKGKENGGKMNQVHRSLFFFFAFRLLHSHKLLFSSPFGGRARKEAVQRPLNYAAQRFLHEALARLK